MPMAMLPSWKVALTPVHEEKHEPVSDIDTVAGG